MLRQVRRCRPHPAGVASQASGPNTAARSPYNPVAAAMRYCIQSRFYAWENQLPDYRFRFGRIYTSVRRAMQAKADMMAAWPHLRLRIIHYYE